MIAMVVLAVGLLGAAALLAQMAGGSVQSRYMSTESLLASEKLDELNRLPSVDPGLAAPPSGTAGNLNADDSETQTVNATTETVAYFDTVQISAGNGAMDEIVTGTDSTGAAQYTISSHTPDGNVSSQTFPGAPPPGLVGSDTITFKRRWLIEADVPVQHARRITVAVALQGVTPARFQSSIVRTLTPDPNEPGCTNADPC